MARSITSEASREVILCGGSINSPQLLMLSGIGDGDALLALDIPVTVQSAGRRKNLQDHTAALLIYGRRDESPLLRNMRLDRMVLALGKGFVFGKGFATDLPGGITAFVKSSHDAPIPDIQLLFISGSLMASPYLPPFKKPFADSFACRVVLLRPESRGRIALASADPLAHPRISQVCCRRRPTGRRSQWHQAVSVISPAAVSLDALSRPKSDQVPMSRQMVSRSLMSARLR